MPDYSHSLPVPVVIASHPEYERFRETDPPVRLLIAMDFPPS